MTAPGVTKRCRLSWLTNSAFVYEPKYEGGKELRGLRNEYTGAQINFGDLTPSIFNLWPAPSSPDLQPTPGELTTSPPRPFYSTLLSGCDK